jgi:hypothetical protein
VEVGRRLLDGQALHGSPLWSAAVGLPMTL